MNDNKLMGWLSIQVFGAGICIATFVCYTMTVIREPWGRPERMHADLLPVLPWSIAISLMLVLSLSYFAPRTIKPLNARWISVWVLVVLGIFNFYALLLKRVSNSEYLLPWQQEILHSNRLISLLYIIVLLYLSITVLMAVTTDIIAEKISIKIGSTASK